MAGDGKNEKLEPSGPSMPRTLLVVGGEGTGVPLEKPNFKDVPKSSVLGRLQAFLPDMAAANEKLAEDMKGRPREDFDIEHVGDEEAPHIEMNLGMGVVDLKDDKAVDAAQMASGAPAHNTRSQSGKGEGGGKRAGIVELD